MNILVLGGTRFVGRYIVEAALAKGHTLTLFHRGKSGEDLFPEVERILGDRDGGLAALGDRTWDAVIDTCGYHPRVVGQSVEALNGRVGTYLFISTVSVYSDKNPTGIPIKEDGEVITFEAAPESEDITGETYGGFKVLCEDVIDTDFQGRVIHVRPGLIVGPHDVTDRFTYWVDRFQGAGDVLVPSPLTSKIQLIDGRDLAALTIKLLESDASGAFNAAAPAQAIPFEEAVTMVMANTVGRATRVDVDEAWLLKQGLKPWSDLPLWMPSSGEGLGEFDVSKSIAHGLTPRPLAETVRDLDVWHASRPQPIEMKAGMSREREQELLAAWRARG